MSSRSMHADTSPRDTGLFTVGSLVAMLVFFAGCACFTLADILLGSNDGLSATLAIIGVPLFLVGGFISFWRARSG
jgi:hypothetical protein